MKHVALKPVLFVVTLVMSVSLACSVVAGTSPTQAPPNQPVETQPPVQLTAEPIQPTEPPATAIPPTQSQFYTEEWDNGLGNWVQQVELNRSDGDKTQAQIRVDSGNLVFDLGKELIAYVFLPSFSYKNVRIDARVDNRGTNVNDVLLVCRKSDEGHYLVNIANSGLYAMYAFDAAKGTYTRIADGGSNKIKQGKDVNDYTLICNDRTLTLLINGNKTRAYTDNQFVFGAGQIGVGVASEEQLPVKVAFESVKISQP